MRSSIFKIQQMIRSVLVLFTLTCFISGCSTRSETDMESYQVGRIRASEGMARGAELSAEGDLRALKENNAELEQMIARLEQLAQQSEAQLKECKKKTRRLGVRSKK